MQSTVNPTVQKLGIKSPYRLLEKMYEDCAQNQFIREFTENAIEAIDGMQSEIYWGYIKIGSVNKLFVADNGPGMTGDELFQYIGNLAASKVIRSQHGVGAKISAIVENRLGLIYVS